METLETICHTVRADLHLPFNLCPITTHWTLLPVAPTATATSEHYIQHYCFAGVLPRKEMFIHSVVKANN